MSRKPKIEIHRFDVPVDDEIIEVALYPPSGRKKTWYAYWKNLPFSRSTGQRRLKDAKSAAVDMLLNGGKVVPDSNAPMTDEEFIEIQRRHYDKKEKRNDKQQTNSSLVLLLEAVDAFRRITELSSITLATPGRLRVFSISGETTA